MKWLKTKSGSGIYYVGISDIILITHAMGFVVCGGYVGNGQLHMQQLSWSKDQVKRMVKAFQSVVNPFQLEHSQSLISLSSGAIMPEEGMIL